MVGKDLFFVNGSVIPLKILNITDADRFRPFHLSTIKEVWPTLLVSVVLIFAVKI